MLCVVGRLSGGNEMLAATRAPPGASACMLDELLCRPAPTPCVLDAVQVSPALFLMHCICCNLLLMKTS